MIVPKWRENRKREVTLRWLSEVGDWKLVADTYTFLQPEDVHVQPHRPVVSEDPATNVVVGVTDEEVLRRVVAVTGHLDTPQAKLLTDPVVFLRKRLPEIQMKVLVQARERRRGKSYCQ
jgi:hypothetical protein